RLAVLGHLAVHLGGVGGEDHARGEHGGGGHQTQCADQRLHLLFPLVCPDADRTRTMVSLRRGARLVGGRTLSLWEAGLAKRKFPRTARFFALDRSPPGEASLLAQKSGARQEKVPGSPYIELSPCVLDDWSHC